MEAVVKAEPVTPRARQAVSVGVSVLLNGALLIACARLLSSPPPVASETQIAVELERLPAKVYVKAPRPSPPIEHIVSEPRTSRLSTAQALKPARPARKSQSPPVVKTLPATSYWENPQPTQAPIPTAPSNRDSTPTPIAPSTSDLANAPIAPSSPDLANAPTAPSSPDGIGTYRGGSPTVGGTGAPGSGPGEPSGPGTGGFGAGGSPASSGTPAVSGAGHPAQARVSAPSGSPAPKGESRGPLALNQPRPSYPPDARDEGVEGTVTLLVRIDARGGVSGVRIERGSGDRRLDRAAEQAVRRWKYSPGLRDGVPVGSAVRVHVHFRLE